MTRAVTEARVPPLRFPGFTAPWEEKRLGEIGSAKSGVGFPENEQGRSEGFPFFKVSDMSLQGNETRMVVANNYVSTAQARRLGMSPIQDEAIIFAKVGAALFLERKRKAKDFLIDNNMMAFVLSKAVDPQFTYFLFSIIQLSKFAQVGALPSFNATDVASRLVHIPDPKEQKKIAGFLGGVDRWVAGLRARRDALADYKRGVMQRLFSRQLRFTRPDGTPFPDWQEKRLGEVFEWIPTNSLPRAAMTDRGGEIQNVHYGDIHTRFSVTLDQQRDQIPFLLDEALIPFPRPDQFCRTGDVIFADASEDAADIGKALEITDVREQSLLAGLHTLLARPVTEPKTIGFFGQMFAAPQFNERVRKLAQGISVLGISKTTLSQMQLEIPHPEEQRKIAGFLGALDRRIDAVTAQITTAEAFKRGLLQQMFV